MNASIMSLEIAVVLLGLGFLLLDLWIAPEHKRKLGYAAALALLVVFAFSFKFDLESFKTPLERNGWHLVSFEPKLAFNDSYSLDTLALFFKRFFLIAAVFVLIM